MICSPGLPVLSNRQLWFQRIWNENLLLWDSPTTWRSSKLNHHGVMGRWSFDFGHFKPSIVSETMSLYLAGYLIVKTLKLLWMPLSFIINQSFYSIFLWWNIERKWLVPQWDSWRDNYTIPTQSQISLSLIYILNHRKQRGGFKSHPFLPQITALCRWWPTDWNLRTCLHQRSSANWSNTPHYLPFIPNYKSFYFASLDSLFTQLHGLDPCLWI